MTVFDDECLAKDESFIAPEETRKKNTAQDNVEEDLYSDHQPCHKLYLINKL